jgi:hypothetical protein
MVAVVFWVADASTDGLVVEMPGSSDLQELGFGDVIVPTVFGGIVGAVLAWAAGRFAARPRVTFMAVCVIGLVVYGVVPFIAANDTASAVWLNVMHVAAAVPIVGGHARRLPRGRSEVRS